MPLLHPDGLHPERGLGPGDALRRATKLHSTLVLRRSTILTRLDALLEILGPAWHAALGSSLANPRRCGSAAGYADPHMLRRLGHARLARFCTDTPAARGTTSTPTPCWPRPPRPSGSGTTNSTSLTSPMTSPSRPSCAGHHHRDRRARRTHHHLVARRDPAASSPPHPASDRLPAR